MLKNIELIKTIETTYYTLCAIQTCARDFEDIEGFSAIKCTIDLLVKDLGRTCLKINEN